jgi:iron complex transport system substrate-binding protein
VSGNGTFIDDLIRRAGGMNVFSDLKGWRIVSVEDLVERNPDVIIVSSGGGMGGSGDLLYRWVMNNLKNVEAVKNSRVYLIDADIISRPSYRLVFALEQIATFLHPGVQFNTSECDFLYESLYIAENAHSENVSQ